MIEIDDGQKVAIETYLQAAGRLFVPGEAVPIATDALIFTEYQRKYVWKTLEEFKNARCIYDPETNEWLVNLVTRVLLKPSIPMIYVDILDDGISVVDGMHRLAAHLIAGRDVVWAQVNAA